MAAGALALVAAGAGFGWWRAAQPVEQPLVRLDVDLGQDVSLATPNGSSNVIISPDGTRLVYLASVSSGANAGVAPRLFIRRLDQPKGIELSGHAGSKFAVLFARQPVGRFHRQRKLNKVSVEGGAAAPLGDAGSSAGSSWGEDGNIVHLP